MLAGSGAGGGGGALITGDAEGAALNVHAARFAAEVAAGEGEAVRAGWSHTGRVGVVVAASLRTRARSQPPPTGVPLLAPPLAVATARAA